MTSRFNSSTTRQQLIHSIKYNNPPLLKGRLEGLSYKKTFNHPLAPPSKGGE